MATETLALQTSTAVEVIEYGDYVYVWSTGGLNVYEQFPAGWIEIAGASLSNVIGGAVNENGVYLATSDRGVYSLDTVRYGDNTGRLFRQYAANDAPIIIDSNVITGIAAKDEALLICTDAGAHFFPTPSTGYTYDAGKAFVTPADSSIPTGTVTGSFANTDLLDGTYLDVQEVAGVPGFEILATFSFVPNTATNIQFYGRYDGSSTHTVNVQAWNYNTLGWDTLGTWSDATTDAYHTYTLTDADHRKDREVQIRIYHTNSGITTHHLYIDYMTINMTNAGCNEAAVSSTKIAYGLEAGGVLTLNHPTANWTEEDATQLTTLSSPALSSNTVQSLEYGTDLFIGNDAGIDIYNGSTVTQILPPTKAVMSASSVVAGTVAAGTFLSTHIQDTTYYQITEATGTPGLSLEMTFNGGIVTVANSLHIYGRYDGGGSPHTVNVQAWNYNTTTWDTLGTLPNSATDALHNFTLTDANHRSSGTVLCRIHQASPGNTGHNVYLDYVYLDIDAGLVVDVKDTYPSATATQTTGTIAICTSDGLDGGRYVVRDLVTQTNLRAVSGDRDVCWVCDRLCYGIYDNILEYFTSFLIHSPRKDQRNVRKDWSFYGELTESIGTIDESSIVLKINGSTVTHSSTAITNGYKITYTPASASNYATPVKADISADILLTGETFRYVWRWLTEDPPELTINYVAPPNVVCLRDISLSATEREDVYNSVNIIWKPEIRSKLVVSESQAQALGTKAIDETTYHRHIRTIRVKDIDDVDVATRTLQEGNIITITASSIGDTARKVQILSKQRVVQKDGNDNRIEYNLIVAHYEAV